MADKHTPEQRRVNMSAVRGRGNKSTEIKFIALLRKYKITGWRRHYPVEGTPDFAFPKKRVAVFIDGCFWHKCPKCYKCPESNKEFWIAKVEENQKRDVRQRGSLRKNGWRVVRVWEHELRGSGGSTARKIQKFLSESE